MIQRFVISILQTPKSKLYFSSSQILPGDFRSQFQYDSNLNQATSPSQRWYIDQNFFEQQVSSIFQKHWVCIGTSESLQSPGDYMCGEFLNQPYIITKGGDGVLRAFFNVCAHRGSQIQSVGQGKCDVLACPYHGWTYNLQGNLIQSTKMKGIKNFRPRDNGLKGINLQTQGKFIFLNFDPLSNKTGLNNNLGGQSIGGSDKNENLSENSVSTTVPPLETTLAPILEAYKKRDMDPEFTDYEFVAQQMYNIKCNWKVYADNWLDGGYHISVLHQDLDKQITPQEYTIENFPLVNLQTTSGSTDRLGKHAVYSFTYPNTLVAAYGPWMDTNIIIPTSVDTCNILMKWFIKKEFLDNQQFIKDSLEASQKVQLEDEYICQMVHRGINSDGYTSGRYVPSLQSGMFEFHQQIFQDISRDQQ